MVELDTAQFPTIEPGIVPRDIPDIAAVRNILPTYSISQVILVTKEKAFLRQPFQVLVESDRFRGSLFIDGQILCMNIQGQGQAADAQKKLSHGKVSYPIFSGHSTTLLSGI